tara:strand:+ start:114 stop:416 length:303 start_codon:yes stop_codon:yes gene_type:complete
LTVCHFENDFFLATAFLPTGKQSPQWRARGIQTKLQIVLVLTVFGLVSRFSGFSVALPENAQFWALRYGVLNNCDEWYEHVSFLSLAVNHKTFSLACSFR